MRQDREMARRQFQVLYRQFLFRMVDLEALSGGALGDMNKLFGQMGALLVFISFGLAIVGFFALVARLTPEAQLLVTWSAEHFLISTTMLVVGLFAVLSWDSTFPGKLDVMMMGPLPVLPRTMFLAKVAAVATALVVAVGALHFFAGLIWPFTFNKSMPAVSAPALGYQPAAAPADADGMETILNADLAAARQRGPLAAGTGGGVAIGVWKKGQRRVVAYGTAKRDSIFEIGSISKTFTGLMLARMAAAGTVTLEEPVRALLPPETVRQPRGPEITLLDLATHHSGLPGLPQNFNPEGKPNPGADYHAAELWAYLAGRGVWKPERAAFEYSNLGVGLLGSALAARAGITYEEMLRREVTGPMGLHDTLLTLSAEQQNRLIQAYNFRRQPVPAWELDALAGAGAIRSTADDMVTYLAANLHPAVGMAAAVTSSHDLRADAIPGMRIALAWLYRSDEGIYWHNGAISGYTSYSFFDPQHDCAAVVLFNSAVNSFDFASVLGEHVRQRLTGQPAISLDSVAEPPRGGWLRGIRMFAVYWLTMLVSGAFVFCCVLGVQGMAAQLLPRGLFLRASSWLQLAAFAVLVGAYFLEPKLAAPNPLAPAYSNAQLEWSPSYWFLGLMQQWLGSQALRPLAARAWAGIAIAFAGTGAAYTLAYFRTMKKVVEEPDIVPGKRGGSSWMPGFGGGFATAVGQFTVRTLLRSRQHRLMFTFYLGLGFAATILSVSSPVAKESPERVETGLLISTVLIMGLCVVGARVVFALPQDLRANWIFRIVPPRTPGECRRARRGASYALSVIPVLLGSAVLLFSLWHWRFAARHLEVLALAGLILGELCLRGTQKIPFTCSYLPGKSNFHMTFLIFFMLIFLGLPWAARAERWAIEDPGRYVAMLAILVLAALGCWWHPADAGELQFEESPEAAVLELGLHRDGVMPVEA